MESLKHMIRSLQHADELDTTYKVRACLAMSYPRAESPLPRKVDRITPMPGWLDHETWEAGLKASGLVAIVEHLYPHETSQAQ